MERLEVMLLPALDVSPLQSTPAIWPGHPIASSLPVATGCMETGTVRVKCIAQIHNAVIPLKPGPLDPEFSALIITSPHYPLNNYYWCGHTVLYVRT